MFIFYCSKDLEASEQENIQATYIPFDVPPRMKVTGSGFRVSFKVLVPNIRLRICGRIAYTPMFRK